MENQWISYLLMGTGSILAIFALIRVMMQGFKVMIWVIILAGSIFAINLGWGQLEQPEWLQELAGPIRAVDLSEILESLPAGTQEQLKEFCERF